MRISGNMFFGVACRFPTLDKSAAASRTICPREKDRLVKNIPCRFFRVSFTSPALSRTAALRGMTQGTKPRADIQKSGRFRHETRSVSRLLAFARTGAISGNRIPLKNSAGAYGAQQRQSFELRSLLCRWATNKPVLTQNTTW